MELGRESRFVGDGGARIGVEELGDARAPVEGGCEMEERSQAATGLIWGLGEGRSGLRDPIFQGKKRWG